MGSWTEGYVTDLLYTYGYYSELNPLNARLLMLSSGIACPDKFETACELGFGQGMSINIHAAASKTAWYGTDFNPAQTDFAKTLASRSGLKVNLFDDSFEDFLENPQVPMFDFIGIHGIWSWISDEARASIIKFIQKKLKVGGVVYCSYNVLPGFLPLLPVRHLLKRHFDLMGSGSGTERAVEDSLQFVKGIMDCGARYGVQVSAAKQKFNEILKQNRHYLAHEYYNDSSYA